MEYRDFFAKVKVFKEEQEFQKKRGLNDYNLLTTVLKSHDEVRLHSRVIGSFLDIDGKHYQRSLFLEKFLKVLDIDSYEFSKSKIFIEYKNIDLYLTDGIKHIIIENKVYAGDQKSQIERYIEIIEKENKEIHFDNMYVVYLSIDRKEPSIYSLGDFKIENKYIVDKSGNNRANYLVLHYKDKVSEWLKESQYEVQHITNLNEAINQYLEVVAMISNQYKGKIMELSDLLFENEEYFNLAKEVSKAYEKAEKKRLNEIKDKHLADVEKSLKNLNYSILDWKAIDIILNFQIRIIMYETNFLIQVTDKENSFEEVDSLKKEKILIALQRVHGNFKSSYNKVYGVLELEYANLSQLSDLIESIDSLISINIKDR